MSSIIKGRKPAYLTFKIETSMPVVGSGTEILHPWMAGPGLQLRDFQGHASGPNQPSLVPLMFTEQRAKFLFFLKKISCRTTVS